ncbi:MAG: hypothetical protein RLZZ490_2206 [Cyanobacteriota bacterium]|jgi:hypothetical protein
MSINAYKLITTLTEDGTLTLNDLPCPAGTSVEVIVLVIPEGELSQYEGQSEEALSAKVKEAGADYLGAIAHTMTEWNSEADNSAYRHL